MGILVCPCWWGSRVADGTKQCVGWKERAVLVASVVEWGAVWGEEAAAVVSRAWGSPWQGRVLTENWTLKPTGIQETLPQAESEQEERSRGAARIHPGPKPNCAFVWFCDQKWTYCGSTSFLIQHRPVIF